MHTNRMRQIKQAYLRSDNSQTSQPSTPVSISTINSPEHEIKRTRPKIFTSINSNIKQYELKASNPLGITFSNDSFPCTIQVQNQCKLPLSFSFSPLLAINNQNVVPMSKNIDTIPRCGGCRAYMNCYNKIQNKKFQCFLCGDSSYVAEYDCNQQPNSQMNNTIYQAIGSKNCYQSIPSQQCIVLVIDICKQSAGCQMLHYASAVIKQVLSRLELDDTILHVFAYNQKVYQFDLYQQQLGCTIIDASITATERNSFGCTISKCRDKIQLLMEYMQELSENCTQAGSNFGGCFSYIYNMTKNIGAKYYILQSNQQLIGQPTINQNSGTNQINKKPVNMVSNYDTKNRNIFTAYANSFLNNTNSISLFVFARSYKNIKVFVDLFNLTNCQIKYYTKNQASDLEKFYYQFSYLLGASYFKDTKVQFIVSKGFHFVNIFGNVFRVKEHITFFANQLDPSKQMLVNMKCSQKVMEVPLHCTIQCVINYRYKMQHVTTVATIVQTVTGSLLKLYDNVNVEACIAAKAQSFLSKLRTQSLANARNLIVDEAACMYKAAMRLFKQKQKIPHNIIKIISSTLAMLKSSHSVPDLILNSPLFDRICAERNFLQFAPFLQISSYFSPYLFDLNNLSQDMCQQGEDLIYPPTVELRFHNVREGLFLLDNGLRLFLFIAKNCDSNLLDDIFGKSKFSKQQTLNQQSINQQTKQANQLRNLIKFLRSQKSLGWIPLYIVRCGQNSLKQKDFYLNFTQESYDQFKYYKLSIQQYLQLLSKQRNNSLQFQPK